MPRIAETRAPAEPSSPDQKDRYRRMLLVAARLGADFGYERVQMHDVANNAGVAIATLYRYFPSKAHLFTAVMRWLIERFETGYPRPDQDDRRQAIADLLVGMSQEMLRYPQLSQAMIQANNQTLAQAVAQGEVSLNDVRFQEIVLDVAGLETPSEEDVRRVRLVVHCWYGVLSSALNGRISLEEAETDIRAACRLLIDPDVDESAP